MLIPPQLSPVCIHIPYPVNQAHILFSASASGVHPLPQLPPSLLLLGTRELGEGTPFLL